MILVCEQNMVLIIPYGENQVPVGHTTAGSNAIRCPTVKSSMKFRILVVQQESAVRLPVRNKLGAHVFGTDRCNSVAQLSFGMITETKTD